MKQQPLLLQHLSPRPQHPRPQQDPQQDLHSILVCSSARPAQRCVAVISAQEVPIPATIPASASAPTTLLQQHPHPQLAAPVIGSGPVMAYLRSGHGSSFGCQARGICHSMAIPNGTPEHPVGTDNQRQRLTYQETDVGTVSQPATPRVASTDSGRPSHGPSADNCAPPAQHGRNAGPQLLRTQSKGPWNFMFGPHLGPYLRTAKLAATTNQYQN
jgi:hypothetical protein